MRSMAAVLQSLLACACTEVDSLLLCSNFDIQMYVVLKCEFMSNIVIYVLLEIVVLMCWCLQGSRRVLNVYKFR
jgi:hypothetical protein